MFIRRELCSLSGLHRLSTLAFLPLICLSRKPADSSSILAFSSLAKDNTCGLYRWVCTQNPRSVGGNSPLKRRDGRNETVQLVVLGGKPLFDIPNTELTRSKDCLLKKHFFIAKKKARWKRRDVLLSRPSCLKSKMNRQRFPSAEARLNYVLSQARRKEASLLEKLKVYEVLKLHGPVVKPDSLTNEELHFLIRMCEKKTNYVPIGRRGVFGGVLLNMHLHWKFHETVKVICKQKPVMSGQMQEYADELARLSGGIPIQFIGNDTIVFYRGKNYEQPDRDSISPIDTLSKRKALEKSKDVQALKTVQHFIAICEKQLELYYQHLSLCSDTQSYIVHPDYQNGSKNHWDSEERGLQGHVRKVEIQAPELNTGIIKKLREISARCTKGIG